MTLESILKKHPSYEENAKQADYLFRSYVGGEQYRRGEYLTQYIGENEIPHAYQNRLAATPLDNHVATVIDIYRSFIFKNEPQRELGALENNPLVIEWLTNTDQEGQTMTSFMKTMNDLAMVLGNVWILVDKPSYKVNTQAEEEALGIRGYACTYTPQNVLNWEYTRSINGKMTLSHIAVVESESTERMSVTHWYKDTVIKRIITKTDTGEADSIVGEEVYDNPLGYIPFVNHSPLKSRVKGIGISVVADIADSQRYIYNLLSELEQSIRISSHPTLVKTTHTQANSGAGAIINLDEQSEPGLNPYLLQPTAAGIDGIISTIELTVDAISRMSHTASVTSSKTAPTSGISLQVERELLFAKLKDIADTVQETEIKLWNIWFDWQNIEKPADFVISYNNKFDMRDMSNDLMHFKAALELNDDPVFRAMIVEKIGKLFED